jgi:hypothetical protein
VVSSGFSWEYEIGIILAVDAIKIMHKISDSDFNSSLNFKLTLFQASMLEAKSGFIG